MHPSTAEADQASDPIHASRLQPKAQGTPHTQTSSNPCTPSSDEPHSSAGFADRSSTQANQQPRDKPAVDTGISPDASLGHSQADTASVSAPPDGNNSTSQEVRSAGACSPDEPASTSGAHRDSTSVLRPRAEAGQSPSQAEARVTDVLPAVFLLLEGCLEALAADVEADAEAAAEAAEQNAVGKPLLDDKVAARAMQALSEAFETVLQFLELVQAEKLSLESPWVLAAIRAYGRQVTYSVFSTLFICCKPHAQHKHQQLAFLLRHHDHSMSLGSFQIPCLVMLALYKWHCDHSL